MPEGKNVILILVYSPVLKEERGVYPWIVRGVPNSGVAIGISETLQGRLNYGKVS